MNMNIQKNEASTPGNLLTADSQQEISLLSPSQKHRNHHQHRPQDTNLDHHHP